MIQKFYFGGFEEKEHTNWKRYMHLYVHYLQQPRYGNNLSAHPWMNR